MHATNKMYSGRCLRNLGDRRTTDTLGKQGLFFLRVEDYIMAGNDDSQIQSDCPHRATPSLSSRNYLTSHSFGFSFVK